MIVFIDFDDLSFVKLSRDLDLLFERDNLTKLKSSKSIKTIKNEGNYDVNQLKQKIKKLERNPYDSNVYLHTTDLTKEDSFEKEKNLNDELHKSNKINDDFSSGRLEGIGNKASLNYSTFSSNSNKKLNDKLNLSLLKNPNQNSTRSRSNSPLIVGKQSKTPSANKNKKDDINEISKVHSSFIETIPNKVTIPNHNILYMLFIK